MPYHAPPPEPTPPPIVQTVQVHEASAADLWQGLAAEQRSQKRSPHKAPSTPPLFARRQPEGENSSIATQSLPLPSQVVLPATSRAAQSVDQPAAPTASLEIFHSKAFLGTDPSVSEAGAIAQNTPPEAAEPSAPTAPEVAPNAATDAADTADENAAEATPIYPRAASPEPFWSNGAVEQGDLLLPSRPTNRPPVLLDLTADYQEFEPTTQIVTARGNVVLRLGNGILNADRLWANLANRFVLVEGNVVFTRGGQTIEAERGEYNLLQGQGSLFQASGTVFLPGLESDIAGILTNNTTSSTPDILRRDPITNVQGTGNINFGTGFSGSDEANAADTSAGGFVRRIRFEAERLDFDAEGWYAEEVRLTNDPFSPPELEFRGNSARLTRLNEFQDELYIENPRLVFDQSFTVPLFRSSVILSRGGADEVNPLFVSVGYDGEDRDGLFVERSFRVSSNGPWEFVLTPQLLLSRFVNSDNERGLDSLGLEADLQGAFGPTTALSANVSFSGLDLNNLEERLRSNVRLRQVLGDHVLNLEATYRDRLFNGSLGFQDVQSSFGAVLLSPTIFLGDSGIALNYQASAQYVTADTDRPEFLEPGVGEDLVSLGRFQGSASLTKVFLLWQGTPLPATRDEGLRFTSRPVVPNLQLILAGRGTYTYYTSNESQENLTAVIGIAGELGHFSRDFFDSTVFNLSYQRSLVGDDNSPFLFDRDVDQNVISGGIIQQIYGPIRVGFQTAFNLDTGENINTDLVLEYSRRTYGIVLRYSPTQSAGFIGFRLSEFDWSGRAADFGGANIRQVEGGVVR